MRASAVLLLVCTLALFAYAASPAVAAASSLQSHHVYTSAIHGHHAVNVLHPHHRVKNAKKIDESTLVSATLNTFVLPIATGSSSSNVQWFPTLSSMGSVIYINTTQDSKWSIELVINTTMVLKLEQAYVSNTTSLSYLNQVLTPIEGSSDLASSTWENNWTDCYFSGMMWVYRVTSKTGVESYYYIQPFLTSCINFGSTMDSLFTSVVATKPDRAIVKSTNSANVYRVFLTKDGSKPSEISVGLTLSFSTVSGWVLYSVNEDDEDLNLLPVSHPPNSTFSQYTTGDVSYPSDPTDPSPCATPISLYYQLGNYLGGGSIGTDNAVMRINIYSYQCYLKTTAPDPTGNDDSDDHKTRNIIIGVVVSVVGLLLIVGLAVWYMKRRTNSAHADVAIDHYSRV